MTPLGACLLLALAAAPPPAECPPGQAVAGKPSPFERTDVRAVAERIVCYCGCPHLQVSKCFCGTADSMRDDIAARLDSGDTADQVVAAFVAEHGTWVLATPPRQGFNWIIWVGPPVALLVGATLLLVLGRRWTRGQARPAVALVSQAGPEDERYRAELADALRRLDSPDEG